jgi:two-component system cell cycle sensor histidine kinase/response regulator CckA
VLVVDDEPFVVKIAQRVLQRDGIEVLTAGTGQQALDVLAAHADIALILLDSSLPDMNAERVLELMREAGFSTPVLLSSGFGAESLPTATQFANVCGFLPKPYPVSQLSSRVGEVLGDSTKRRSAPKP